MRRWCSFVHVRRRTEGLRDDAPARIFLLLKATGESGVGVDLGIALWIEGSHEAGKRLVDFHRLDVVQVTLLRVREIVVAHGVLSDGRIDQRLDERERK